MNLFENLNNVNRTNENKVLVNKWAKSGLLEGLKAQDQATVSVLLENQAKQLIKEGSATTSGAATSGFEQWTGVALPLIRRVFAEIAAKEFVSVQPMNLPSGLVFYLDFKYGTNRAPFGFAPEGANQTGTLQGITSQSGAPSDGLYGAGRFGYSFNYTSSNAATATTGSVTVADVNHDSAYTGSLSNYRTFTIALPSDADQLAVRGFQPYSGSVALTANTDYYPAFTKVVGSNVQFVVTASIFIATASGPSVTSSKISYIVAPTNDNRGDFEAAPVSSTNRTETTLSIPEIELQMRSVPVTAKTRKLKASWTPEFAQDLNAYHSVDAEAELTAMLSEYVSMEVDLEILDMLIAAATNTEYWSAKNNNFYSAATVHSNFSYC
jgi:hypothetical protein